MQYVFTIIQYDILNKECRHVRSDRVINGFIYIVSFKCFFKTFPTVCWGC